MVSPLWSLSFEVFTARMIVRLGGLGREGHLSPETHQYFFERYSRLADHHRTRGNVQKAKRFSDRAEAHRAVEDVEDDGPPYAAAMAMPRPRPYLRTNAVARSGWRNPDDAA
jgi:hypothetical protein